MPVVYNFVLHPALYLNTFPHLSREVFHTEYFLAPPPPITIVLFSRVCHISRGFGTYRYVVGGPSVYYA